MRHISIRCEPAMIFLRTWPGVEMSDIGDGHNQIRSRIVRFRHPQVAVRAQIHAIHQNGCIVHTQFLRALPLACLTRLAVLHRPIGAQTKQVHQAAFPTPARQQLLSRPRAHGQVLMVVWVGP